MRLSISLREDTERDVVRVSLRSVDDFPCNKMAEQFFNGGGHRMPRAANCPSPLTKPCARPNAPLLLLPTNFNGTRTLSCAAWPASQCVLLSAPKNPLYPFSAMPQGLAVKWYRGFLLLSHKGWFS